MSGDASIRRDFHVALGLSALPGLFLPYTWLLALRHRAALARSTGPDRDEQSLWLRRLWTLALVDTIVALLLLLAAVLAPDAAPLPRPAAVARPLFEPIRRQCHGPTTADLLGVALPVGVATLLLLGAWWWGTRRPGKQRWPWVLLPLAGAPVVGLAAARGLCAVFGGWSAGVVLLALIAQSGALLVLGLGARWLAKGELDVMLAPRLSTGHATALASFYMIVSVTRAIVVIGAAWALCPELRPPSDSGLDQLVAAGGSPAGVVLVLLAVAVVAPVAEEVVFRGVLLPGLARRMTPESALLLSSLVFALFHVPSHGAGAVAPGVLAMVFGWARLRTGSLAAPIVLHAANNLLVALVSLWRVA